MSGVLVAGAILGYQSLSRSGEESKERKAKAKAKAVPTRSELYADAAARLAADDARREDALAAVLSGRAQAGEFDASLIAEALARTAAFLDAPGSGGGLAAVRASFVVVVGLGGVGSHCVSALARSGVGRIRVIDFDQVSLSSLNRHALATLADVGTSKVGCVARRLAAAVPWIRVQQRGVKFDLSVADALLGPWGEPRFPGGKDMRVPRRREEEDVEATWEWETKMPDFVVDAIDNIDTKVDLLAYCATHGIPVVSAMGAGCKSDPTRLLVADVSRGTDDPLARSTRRRLRLRGVDPALVHMVYSAEPVTGREAEGKARLLPLPDEEFDKGQVGELAVLPNFRARILPVIGTLPAVFGYAVANHVILEISGMWH